MPESAQEQAVSYLEQYLFEITEEVKWKESFTKPSPNLLSMIKKVKKDIKAGKAVPFSESVFEQRKTKKTQHKAKQATRTAIKAKS